MKAFTITDIKEIPTVSMDTFTTIKDRHNGGTRTIDITGFWIVGGDRLAIDIGEHIHCLNEVCLSEDGEIELGTSSIAGLYVPGEGYRGNGSNNVTGRITVDNMEEAISYYSEFKQNRLRKIREAKKAS